MFTTVFGTLVLLRECYHRVAPGARCPTDAMKLWYVVEHHLARGSFGSLRPRERSPHVATPFFGADITQTQHG
jgi:hypothetical protein